MKQEQKEQLRERAADNKEFARFDDFVKRIMAVPKEEIDKKAAEYEQQKKQSKSQLRRPRNPAAILVQQSEQQIV